MTEPDSAREAGPLSRKSQAASDLHPFREELLDLAGETIDHGLERAALREPELARVSRPLREIRASFVTLRKGGELRGCIGTVQAHRPLALDVANNAFGAAFRDPRFAPLTRAERTRIDITIEVLTVPEPLVFTTEDELVAQLVPGVDGLVLEAGTRKGTFLPTVWQQLPHPEAFWRHLKQKAGLPPDHFSPTMRVLRYRTEILP